MDAAVAGGREEADPSGLICFSEGKTSLGRDRTRSGACPRPGTGTARGCSPWPGRLRATGLEPGRGLDFRGKKKIIIAFNKDAPCSGGEQSPQPKPAPPSVKSLFLLKSPPIQTSSGPGCFYFFFFSLPSSLSTPKRKEDKEGNFAHTTTTTKKKRRGG